MAVDALRMLDAADSVTNVQLNSLVDQWVAGTADKPAVMADEAAFSAAGAVQVQEALASMDGFCSAAGWPFTNFKPKPEPYPFE